MSNSAARVVYPLIVAVVLIGLWQGLVVAFEIPAFLVPSPARVAQTLVADANLLFGALYNTLRITLFSFIAAVVVGVVVAAAFVQSRMIETAFFPYAVLLQVTPIVAIAPLIIIWVKDPLASLVICATLVALFPIISNTTLGLRSVNPGLLAYFRMNRASRMQLLFRLRVPSALPYFFRRAANQLWAGPDRRGGCRICRWHWRYRNGVGLPDPAGGLSAEHSTYVRGAGPHHRSGGAALCAHVGAVALGAGRLARKRDIS